MGARSPDEIIRAPDHHGRRHRRRPPNPVLHFAPVACYNTAMEQPAGTTAQQTEEQRQSSCRPGLLKWLAFFLFVVYPLSVGPVAWLDSKYHFDRKIWFLYVPIGVLYNNCKPVKAFYDWYLYKVWHVPGF